jgi:hypothetical protein
LAVERPASAAAFAAGRAAAVGAAATGVAAAATVVVGRGAAAVAPETGAEVGAGALPVALQALTNRTARKATDISTRIEALPG